MATSATPTTDAADMAQLLRVLSHPVRLEIVRLIGSDELPVGDVAASVGLSQPLTSQHLRVLREHEIVDVRQDGNRRLYRASSRRAAEIRSFLDELWPASLQELKAVAEQRHRASQEESPNDG